METEFTEFRELVNLNNEMSDYYQVALPLDSNNANSFVYALLLLKSPSTRYCISGTKHFVTGPS